MRPEPASLLPRAIARKAVSRILRALDLADEGAIAQGLGIDPTTLSKKKNEKRNNGLTDLEFFCALLERLGLKVVPANHMCIDRPRLEAVFVLAKGYMGRAETVDDLFHLEMEDRDDLNY